MDDTLTGIRNKRGDWAPKEPAQVAPVWSFPWDVKKVLKWLPGYFLPYEPIWIVSTLFIWFWVLPDVETMKHVGLDWVTFGWVFKLFVVNTIALFAFYGVIEWQLYYRRAQGTRFKYNAKWPSENPSDVFWFKSQSIDSSLRIFFHAMPIWTAIEVFMLWMFANHHVQWLSWAEHPYWLAFLIIINPILHEVHFYAIHRMIHIPFLYKHVHSVHHNSVNPSPLSSLSMHPVELILYLGMACWQLIIPSNPIVAIYALHRAGFGAIPGHVGFEKVEVGENGGVDTHAYIHYLHHKYFEVNYGDGLIPLDKWTGTFHDGSKEAQARMEERYAKKVARVNA